MKPKKNHPWRRFNLQKDGEEEIRSYHKSKRKSDSYHIPPKGGKRNSHRYVKATVGEAEMNPNN